MCILNYTAVQASIIYNGPLTTTAAAKPTPRTNHLSTPIMRQEAALVAFVLVGFGPFPVASERDVAVGPVVEVPAMGITWAEQSAKLMVSFNQILPAGVPAWYQP